jgi:hypothetical protein
MFDHSKSYTGRREGFCHFFPLGAVDDAVEGSAGLSGIAVCGWPAVRAESAELRIFDACSTARSNPASFSE